MTLEELGAFGLQRMDDAEIRSFLGNQKMGVLALPTDGAPYMVPLSYGYDGESRLYFTYLLGAESRKGRLSDANDEASFLVYRVDTPYNWESVQVRGHLQEVPEGQWDDIEDVLASAWRPDLFQQAGEATDVAVYELAVLEESGIKHTGLPPGLEPRRRE